MPEKKKRVRRRPEEARRLILDAAEAGMTADGPAGLRLQDVARHAGVSHSTILHHFGSREGLVRALNLRNLEDLKRELIPRMGSANADDDAVKLTFAAYRNGLAQRMLWLMQSSNAQTGSGLSVFDDMVQAVQETRERLAKPGRKIDIADSRAIVHLTTIAAFGDAVLGARLRQSSGAKERAAREQFENWFGNLLELYFRTGD